MKNPSNLSSIVLHIKPCKVVSQKAEVILNWVKFLIKCTKKIKFKTVVHFGKILFNQRILIFLFEF